MLQAMATQSSEVAFDTKQMSLIREAERKFTALKNWIKNCLPDKRIQLIIICQLLLYNNVL